MFVLVGYSYGLGNILLFILITHKINEVLTYTSAVISHHRYTETKLVSEKIGFPEKSGFSVENQISKTVKFCLKSVLKNSFFESPKIYILNEKD